MYYTGEGVAVNYPLAREHCEAAAGQNYAPALTLQGLWHWEGKVYPQSTEKAENLWEEARAAGDARALYLLEKARDGKLSRSPAPRSQRTLQEKNAWENQLPKLGRDIPRRDPLEPRWNSVIQQPSLKPAPSSPRDQFQMPRQPRQ